MEAVQQANSFADTARVWTTMSHANVARYFADAEAIYSYEGTNDINTLIVGRAITGLGAFV